MSMLKPILIAAALGLALPAIAADEPAAAQKAPAEKAAVAKDKAATSVEKEKVAVGVAPTLPQVAKKDEKAANGATAVPAPALRFEGWVHDEDRDDYLSGGK